MRKRTLTCLLFLLFVGCISTPPKGQSNIEATPDSEMPQERHQNLPKDFHGDSLSSLIDKLEHIEESSKDEFKKTSERNAEIAALRVTPYRFVISPGENTIWDENYNKISGERYDADAEVMKVNLWVNNNSFFNTSPSLHITPTYTTILVEDYISEGKSYIGQNTYGAKAEVSSTLRRCYGLAIANVKQQPNTALFSLSFPIEPSVAKVMKGEMAFYVDVELTSSEYLIGNIQKAGAVRKATIASPVEIHILEKYVLVNVKEVGWYSKSSGEVLSWKKFK